jgi:hypothetical protein
MALPKWVKQLPSGWDPSKLPEVYWRFRHLKQAGVVSNRQTLSRWIATNNFPPGKLIGPNCRVWLRADVEHWMKVQNYLHRETA